MTSESPARKRHRFGMEGEHPQGDLGQLILLAVFLVVWILDSFIFRLSTFPASSAPLFLRLPAAGLIFGLAVGTAVKGHIVISEETLRQGRLVKNGIFGRVRHPLYCAALLLYTGLFLTTLSLLALATLGGIFLFYNFIASYEERFLVQKHGEEYLEYRRKVPKWIPRLNPAR